MRHVVSGRATLADKHAASRSELGRFETETLRTKGNVTALMNLSGQWIDSEHRRKPPKRLILALDSSVSETMANKRAQRTTGTSIALDTTRCSCSIRMATWNGPFCGTAITPAQSSGGGCYCR